MKVLVYTAPARGHLFPTMPILLELQRRGHEVVIRTIGAEVDGLRALGFTADPVDPAIDDVELADFKEHNPLASLKAGVANFIARGELQIPDVQQAIADEQPDLMLVDVLCWGAAAVAEASGLPWASIQHSPTPLPAPEVPPFGPGLRPMTGALGRLRNRLLTPLTLGMLERVALPGTNALRARVGVTPLRDVVDMFTRPPVTLYLTSRALEYPRAKWPESFVFTGTLNWDPAREAPSWLAELTRPVALVTTSSEFQDDGVLVRTALDALAGEDLDVVATMPAGVEGGAVPGNAHVAEFVPHSLLLPTSAVAVTHGGFGATQKALAAGVPVVVVPFGRDQAEVGRRVQATGAGVMLSPKRLTPDRLREVALEAITLKPAAVELAAKMAAEGGAPLAADRLEALHGRSAAGR
ncbi:glycosyltransferase [Terrabacter carboxydivorans]|uniref:Glycosyltransferase n=1 Tax=Terrabacter carboxydivorans TaxID=619730 RepID=A0ABP5ZJB5_9MICO